MRLVILLDVGNGALHEQLAMVDEGDGVAHLLDSRHVVGGEHDRGSLLLKALDEVLEQGTVDRVETAEGFVEDHEFRFVYKRCDDLHLLLVTLGKFLHSATSLATEVEDLHIFAHDDAQACGIAPFQLPEIHDLVFDAHFIVKPAFLGHVSDLSAGLQGSRNAVDGDRPRIADEQTVDDAQEGCLSGAVRTEKTADFTFLNVETDVIEGLRGGIVLHQAVDFEYVHCYLV